MNIDTTGVRPLDIGPSPGRGRSGVLGSVAAILIVLASVGRVAAQDGTWPPASLVLPEGDTSALWNYQEETLSLISGERFSLPEQQGYPGYSHSSPEYVLGNRVAVRVPSYVRPSLSSFGRFDGELDLVPEDACTSSGHLIEADSTTYAFCSGWWPVFSGDLWGWRNGSVDRRIGANPRFDELLFISGIPSHFDLADWASDRFARTSGGSAFARVATGRQEGGFPGGQRFAWGDDSVYAEVEAKAAVGMAANDPDWTDVSGFPLLQVTRIESDVRATASLPFRVIQQPGTPTGSLTLGRIRLRLDNPIDVQRPAGMAAWRYFSLFSPAMGSRCSVSQLPATFADDDADCSRMDLVRSVSISTSPRGIEVPVADWLVNAASPADVIDQRSRWLQWGDFLPRFVSTPADPILGPLPIAEQAAVDEQPLGMDTDVPLAASLWLNLYAQARLRMGLYEDGLISGRSADTVRIRARVQDAVGKAEEPGWLELDPSQPGAETLQIIASAAGHKARLVDDLLPGPASLRPRIVAQHPDALLLAVGDVPLGQRQLMLWQGPGQIRTVILPVGSQVSRVALAERGFLLELIGAPVGASRLQLLDPLSGALKDAADPAIVPLGGSFPSVNIGFPGWRGDRGEVWFSAVDERDEDFPNQLWRTDGSPEGTRLEATVGEGNYTYDPLGRVGPHLVFAALSRNPADNADERANGVVWSVASGLLQRLPMAGAYEVRAVSRVGQQLLIQARSALPGDGTAIWSTDGTPLGTFRLDNPSQSSSLRLDLLHWDEFTGIALLRGTGIASGERSLWVTDGSPGSLAQIASLPSGWEVPLGRMAWHDGYLYFALNHTRVERGELWRTDGTPSSTQRIEAPWSADAEQGRLIALRSVNGFLFYGRAPERTYWRPPLTQVQRATFPELWTMTKPEVQWRVFYSQLPGRGQGTPSPISPLSYGDISDVFTWRNGVIWVATGDPSVSTHLKPIHGEELFGFDTAQPTLLDPNFSRLPREGALPAPPYTGPLIRRIWVDGFEDLP